MKISVDGKNCCGHARCWNAAPDVYPLDSDGYNIYRGQTVEIPKGKEAEAIRGARACPDKVITIIDEA